MSRQSFFQAQLFYMPWIGKAKKQREFVEQAKAAGLRPQIGAMLIHEFTIET